MLRPSGRSKTWNEVRAVAALMSALVVSIAAAGAAQGKVCSRCFHDVGLAQFYTRSNSNPCQGSIRDPINVVWFDYQSTSKFSNKVHDDLQNYSTNYSTNPSGDNGPTWFGVPQTDPQTIRDVLKTCPAEASDMGTDGPVSSDRGHVRLFNVDTQNFWFVVGDAHEDYDPSGTGLNCHGSKSFDGPKRQIYGYFPTPKHFQFWGNTMPIYQSCLHRKTASNGWVAVIKS